MESPGSNPLTYNDYVSLRRVQDDLIGDEFRSIRGEIQDIRSEIQDFRHEVLTHDDYVSLRRVQDDLIGNEFRSVRSEIQDLESSIRHEVQNLESRFIEFQVTQKRTEALFRNWTARHHSSRLVPFPKYDPSHPEAGIVYPDTSMFPHTFGQFHVLRRPTSDRQRNMVRYLAQFYDVTAPTRNTAQHAPGDEDAEDDEDDEDFDDERNTAQMTIYEIIIYKLADLFGIDTDRFPSLKVIPDPPLQPLVPERQPVALRYTAEELMHTPEDGGRVADSMEISFPRIGWGSETTSELNRRNNELFGQKPPSKPGSHKAPSGSGDGKDVSTVPNTATPDSARIRSAYMKDGGA